MAKQVNVGSLVLILAGEGEGDTGIVNRVDRSGNIRVKMNRGPKSGKFVLSRKGHYKVIT